MTERSSSTSVLSDKIHELQLDSKEVMLKLREFESYSLRSTEQITNIQSRLSELDNLLRRSGLNPSVLERLHSLEVYVQGQRDTSAILAKTETDWRQFLAKEWFKLIISLATSGGLIYWIVTGET